VQLLSQFSRLWYFHLFARRKNVFETIKTARLQNTLKIKKSTRAVLRLGSHTVHTDEHPEKKRGRKPLKHQLALIISPATKEQFIIQNKLCDSKVK
jgi:hypothetical protein